MTDYVVFDGQAIPVGNPSVGGTLLPAFVLSLRSVTASSSRQVISTDGFTSTSDGGGGVFVWNSTDVRADNGGTIIAVTGVATGRWNRVFSGPLDVKWFGAKGDGSTDDTAAIVAADAAAAAAGGTGRVLFSGPNTTYKTATGNLVPSAGVSWEGPAQSNILGASAGVTINCTAAAPAIKLTNVAWIRRLNITSAGGGIQFNAHLGDILGGGLEDISVSNIGATSIGIEFLTDNSHFVYFPTFSRVSVAIPGGLGAPYQGATGVAQTGTSGQCIRLQWFGGRISGVGKGIETSNSQGWVASGVAFDNIANNAATVNISGVNVGSGVVTTSSAHGLSVGSLVNIVGVGGVTGINGVRQVATTPLTTTFTLFNVALGGSYTAGGTVGLANGVCIHIGAASEANMFRNLIVELPAVEAVAICEATSYQNIVELSNDLAVLPSQMLDKTATQNTLVGSDASGGFISTISTPQKIAGVLLQSGVAASSSGGPLNVNSLAVTGGGTVAATGDVRLQNAGQVTQAVNGGSAARNLIGGLVGGFNRCLIGDPNDQLSLCQSPRLQVHGLEADGHYAVDVKTVSTSPYTVDSGATQDYVLLVNKASAVSITLPDPNFFGGGSTVQRTLTVKDISNNASVNNITINHHASENVEGATSYVISTNRGSVTLVSDGSNWYAISKV